MFAWYRLVYYPAALFSFVWLLLTHHYGSLSLAPLFVIAAWSAWVTPHLQGPYVWKLDPPKKTYRNIRFSIVWMIPICFMCALLPLRSLYGSTSAFWFWTPLGVMIALASLGMFSVPAQYKHLRRRFIRAAHQWQVCFNCGYDMRASETCPECGYHDSLEGRGETDPTATHGVN